MVTEMFAVIAFSHGSDTCAFTDKLFHFLNIPFCLNSLDAYHASRYGTKIISTVIGYRVHHQKRSGTWCRSLVNGQTWAQHRHTDYRHCLRIRDGTSYRGPAMQVSASWQCCLQFKLRWTVVSPTVHRNQNYFWGGFSNSAIYQSGAISNPSPRSVRPYSVSPPHSQIIGIPNQLFTYFSSGLFYVSRCRLS